MAEAGKVIGGRRGSKDFLWGAGDIHATISGLLVRLHRERRGFSREHLARLSGLCRSTIGDLERGTQQVDTFDLGALSGALGTTGDVFLATVKDAQARAKRAVLPADDRAAGCPQSPRVCHR